MNQKGLATVLFIGYVFLISMVANEVYHVADQDKVCHGDK